MFRGLTKDPWDTYQYILDTLNKFSLNSIIFFLVGRYSAKNKNLHYSSPIMRRLIRYIANNCKIGLHPSFYTSLSFKTIQKEKLRLESISGEKISRSRQHFLKFKLPDTYLHLVKAGISEDYSMGFADSAGFRAGICSPFFFYDLKNEQITALKIFPVTCMEGNFIKYMNKTPEQSVYIISTLLDKVKSVDGLFISIWHNHTLSDRGVYKGWKSVHDRMIEKIMSFQDNF